DFMTGVEEGDKLDIEYLRDGKVGRVEVEPRVSDANVLAWVGPREQGMPIPPRAHVAPNVVERFRYALGGWHGAWADMEIVELNEGLGRYFGTDKGLLVISAPKSDALKLEDGDVIQSIDGREPKSVNHCMRILASYQPGETLELDIMRDKRRQKIEIEMPADRSSRFVPAPGAAPTPAAAPLALPAPEPPGIEST
ncbi:MAG: PDZ domain-containing protein, partial [Woeseiaceae bacterium]|nr:PDZ domain-containing protein [Woeseiaceae bacterium]